MILYIVARVVKAIVPKYFAKNTKERPNDDLNDFELSRRNEDTDSEDRKKLQLQGTKQIIQEHRIQRT